MTQEEKARAYDEALERAMVLRQEAIDKGYALDYIKDYETIFPELAESEDERIRMALIKLMTVAGERYVMSATGFKKEQLLAYLEKQKDLDKMIVVSPEVWDKAISDAYENGKRDSEKQKEPHYTKRNALFDKCVENCDPTVMKKVSDEVDEMLEKEQQKEPLRDFIDDFPYSIEQKEQEFTHHEVDESLAEAVTHQMEDDGDVDDFVRKDLDDIVLKYAELGAKWQKEQKPSTPKYRVGDVMRTKQESAEGITDGLPVIVSVDDNYYYCTNEKIPISEQEEYEFPPMNMRQKPVEIDELKIIKKHITEDSLSSDVNKRLKDCGWYVTDEKPMEWSEEDVRNLNNIIWLCENCIGGHETTWIPSQAAEIKDLINRVLKSLRPQQKTEGIIGKSKEIPSNWKPSEEQMEALKDAVRLFKETHFEKFHYKIESLYEQLKKLQN